MKNKEYLYHYTSLETLALILKHKTIRFSRLDLVDDPEEIITKDYGNLGRFMFVSCWTDSKEESIPMWKMYSSDLKGVRIKLPKLPFQEYTIEQPERKSKLTTYIDPLLLGFHRNYTVVPYYDNLLIDIIYTDNIKLLFPQIAKTEHSLDFSNLGKYKRTVWKFQKEKRYILFAYPWGQEELLNRINQGDRLPPLDKLKYGAPNNRHIDFTIDNDKFKEMEIILGPKSTEADKIIVNLLVKEFNPEAIIMKSVIKIV